MSEREVIWIRRTDREIRELSGKLESEGLSRKRLEDDVAALTR